MRTFDEIVAAYPSVFIWNPVQSEVPTPLVASMHEGFQKKLVFSINKALLTLVDTTTDWHVQNSRTMLTRQPTVSLLYVLATASFCQP